jgi:3-dehydroquinate synthase
VVSPVNDFVVKSSLHDYRVNFIDNTSSQLMTLCVEGDIIIVDDNIFNLYPKLFTGINKNIKIMRLKASESQKSYEGIIPIINDLINNGFRKNNRLIAIGGGIIQDITAFISSIMFRGVDWFLFPTTLLAQGDSCIGSKTSINFKKFKNQIGGFYPPSEIFINTNFLDTLSQSDLQSGLGEMCHYFIIAGEDKFNDYKKKYYELSKNKEILSKMVLNSLQIKKEYIEIDEFDQNKRRIFNYGHSFGHAIESLTKYKVPHGIAVSIGMDIANFISVKKRLMSESTRLEIRELLEKIWNGFKINKLNVNDFALALSKDKKNIGKKLRLILCRNYGDVFIVDQNLNDEFKSWLSEYFINELK